MNKQLLASLLLSLDESSMRLAILLCNWDFGYMRKIMMSTELNPSGTSVMCFSAVDRQFTAVGTNGSAVYIKIPLSKRVNPIIYSWI